VVAAGRGGDGATLGGAAGVRDGIDMLGIARFIAADDILDPDGVGRPPISCAPTTLERITGARAVQRICHLAPNLSIVGSPRRHDIVAQERECYRRRGR
jgi:hypothetical protein